MINNQESIFTQVKASLLDPYNISIQDLDLMMSEMLSKGIDMGDIYFQNIHQESWTLEDGLVKKSSYASRQGVGFRSIVNEQSGLAYSESLEKDSLFKAARASSSIAKSGKTVTSKIEEPSSLQNYYSCVNPISSLEDKAKIELLQDIDSLARSKDHRVKEVIASLAGNFQNILIVNDLGRIVADIRPMVRLSLSVIVEEGDRKERGTSGGGGRVDYTFFNQSKIKTYVAEAVDQALINLEAVEAPAGEMTVVLGSGWPGVLVHEAIGHGLEGDFNRKKTSAFSGLMGEKVASSICTVIDDGTIKDARGSLNVDDEGEPTERTVLIEDGKLCNYMQDQLNARLMNTKSTGNGRRESYSTQTIPRMTNTFMLGGNHKHEEIIESVDEGIYAKNFGGGQVDITSGKFVFSANEAYLIKNGKIDRPIKGAMLIGDGPSALNKVSMIADDLALDPGIGNCGKDGQTVPVNVGQPTMKIENLTVGGTA